MKKIFKVVSSFLVIGLLFSISFSSKANAASISDKKVMTESEVITSLGIDKDTAIKNVISNYFKTEFEAIKQKEYDNDVIYNSKIKKYQAAYAKFLSEWYKKKELNLVSYNQAINIKSIVFENSDYIVNVENQTEMVFDIAPEITQKAINSYRFVLTEINGNWKVKDFTDLSDSSFNLDSKLKEINNKIENIDSLIQTFTPSKTITTPLSPIVSTRDDVWFTRSLAVTYAHAYWSQRNTYYPYWDGNDCTNFVSQCWERAGVPVTSSWYANSKFDYTTSWTVVDDFKTYMINNGWCYLSSNSSNVQLADVIQLYNSSKKTWSHSVITTYIDKSDNLYYTAHSTSRYDYGLYNVYPSSTYSNVRYLCVYNF